MMNHPRPPDYEPTTGEREREETLKDLCKFIIRLAVEREFINQEHGQQMLAEWFEG
jgi:hypothetical protein